MFQKQKHQESESDTRRRGQGNFVPLPRLPAQRYAGNRSSFDRKLRRP
jgi:hypothetical protein